MVNGTDRAKNYANFLKADVPYLQMKAMMRNKTVDVSKISAIAAIKDAHGKTIIDSFILTGRERVLAWRAWRELYFMYYRYQKAEKVAM